MNSSVHKTKYSKALSAAILIITAVLAFFISIQRPSANAEVITSIAGGSGSDSLPLVMLGSENQACKDVVISETRPGSLASYNPEATEGVPAYQQQWLRLSLKGEYFRFYSMPVITVESGDIVLGQAILGGDDAMVAIPIKASSHNQAAVIRISSIRITVDRNAPQGIVYLWTDCPSGNPPSVLDSTNITGSFNQERAASIPIAMLTSNPPLENEPASDVVHIATFVVGSAYYTEDGIVKAMDASSYTKDGRAFVPMRFLARALGCEDSGILWNQESQSITVSWEGKVVGFVIGQAYYTLNGDVIEMDTRPELKDGRVFLPGRYLAEALGYTVSWDEVTGTVTFTRASF